jgi:hypothetical protein
MVFGIVVFESGIGTATGIPLRHAFFVPSVNRCPHSLSPTHNANLHTNRRWWRRRIGHWLLLLLLCRYGPDCTYDTTCVWMEGRL